jgi:hypothetical protein
MVHYSCHSESINFKENIQEYFHGRTKEKNLKSQKKAAAGTPVTDCAGSFHLSQLSGSNYPPPYLCQLWYLQRGSYSCHQQ